MLYIRKIQSFLAWSELATKPRVLHMNYYRVTSFKFSIGILSFMQRASH